MALVIVLCAAGIFLLWFIFTYNRFIGGRNMLMEAWSGIDVQLKRRYDLIPNIVESVKGYAKHEKSLFQDIAELRSRCMGVENPGDKGPAESALSEGLKKLFAVAEAYPQLRASENFINLQQNLSELEDQIQMARRYYNGTARNFNILLQSFPSLIVGRMFSFAPAEFFEVEAAAERKTPEVKF